MDKQPDWPNVLLIVTDQQRWDTLGCYGNEVIETANLDWLGAEGTVFTRAYSPVPACIPARASLMMGMDQWHTGIVGNGSGNPPVANLTNTLPTALAAAGYHTQGVGKMHFVPQRSLQGFHHTTLDEEARVQDADFVSDYTMWFRENAPSGVDRYDHGIDQNSWLARPYHLPEHLHATNWTAAESIRFLQRRDPTRPFFLKTSFARPHSPYDPPAVYFDRYLAAEIPPPVRGDWVDRMGVSTPAADPNAWQGKRPLRDVHRARAGYYGAINHIDHQIGRITRYLRNHRLDDDTLVVFCADHGDMLGDHDYWRKTRPYEGSTHIPLIVRLPRSMRQGKADRVDAPVCLADIMPTILDAVGISAAAPLTGRSMVQLIRGESGTRRQFLHGEYTRHQHASAMHFLTDESWKYLWFADSDIEQLFHLAGDPYELKDLAADPAHAETLRLWRRRLVQTLEVRDAGLTRDGALQPQDGRPPVLSPHAPDRRRPARNEGASRWRR